MNFLAGFLLIVLEDEEDAYWALGSLTTNILAGYYSRRMTTLRVDIELLAHSINKYLPHIAYVRSRRCRCPGCSDCEL